MPETPTEGRDNDGEQGEPQAERGRGMSEARVEVGATDLRVPPQVVRRLTSTIPAIAERVSVRVQAEIPAYAGSAGGRRRRLIVMAVTESAGVFLRLLSGPAVSTAGLDDLFRRMGYGEASDGNNLDDLEKALRISGREAWRGLQDVIIDAGLSAATLGRLADELSAFLDHLADEAQAGYAMALRARERDVAVSRRQLFDALVRGEGMIALHRYADASGWPLPTDVVAIAGEAADSGSAVEWPDSDDLGGRAIAETSEDRTVYLVSSVDAGDIVARLSALSSRVILAQSWPVPLAEAAHAYRWAVRALELAATGPIPRQPVIDCSRYSTQLWLHAEPALRRQLAQELLKPLFAETPNSREILSATLLVWLETRESAPAIASILGVHPQTVRYRWRRINELFGDALHDAEFVVQLTMLLKASVPLWVAGDQSDFERYRSEEAR